MNAIDRIRVRFDRLAARDEAALIPYFVAGFPRLSATREALWQSYEAGASLIELGIPFSDPVADGPTIQRASHAALQAGMTPRKALDFVASLRREGFDLPILGMTYANLVFAGGLDSNLKRWRAAGLDGAIIPDVSLEDGAPFRSALAREGLGNVAFASPSSPPRRIHAALRASTAFLYVVGVYGTTGARSTVPASTLELLARVRQERRGDRPPICVGFGISTPQQVRSLVRAGAEGVIVGSALADEMARGRDVKALLKRLKAGTVGASTTLPQRI